MHGFTSQAFAPEDLECLDGAFKTAWAMLVAANPARDTSKDEGMKTLLRKRLLTIDVATINDEDLRQIAHCLTSPS